MPETGPYPGGYREPAQPGGHAPRPRYGADYDEVPGERAGWPPAGAPAQVGNAYRYGDGNGYADGNGYGNGYGAHQPTPAQAAAVWGEDRGAGPADRYQAAPSQAQLQAVLGDPYASSAALIDVALADYPSGTFLTDDDWNSSLNVSTSDILPVREEDYVRQYSHDRPPAPVQRGRHARDVRDVASARLAERLLAEAEDQAAEMWQDARESADQIRRTAEADAAVYRQRAAYEDAALREAAEREAAELRQQAAVQAAELRQVVEQEVAQLREQAAAQAAAIRQAATQGAAELRDVLTTMSAELGRVSSLLGTAPALPGAGHATEHDQGYQTTDAELTAPPRTGRPPTRPAGAPERPARPPGRRPAGGAARQGPARGAPAREGAAARRGPAARANAPAAARRAGPAEGFRSVEDEEDSPRARRGAPAALPATPARPRPRPATRPGERPAPGKTRPKGAPRQQRTAKIMATTIVALLAVALTTGGAELAAHGYTFFVFRSGGTGATDKNAVFPGILPTPKPSPSHPSPSASPPTHRRHHHHHHRPAKGSTG